MSERLASMTPWAKIAKLSGSEIENLQSRKLHDFLTHQVYPFSPFYRQLFDSNHISPGDIRHLRDLNRIPLISKNDFRGPTPDSERFRDFILQPDEEKLRKFLPKTKLLSLALTSAFRGSAYTRFRLGREYRPSFITFTTGTTSKPVAFAYSSYDIQNLYLSGTRMLTLFAMTEEEKAVNLFPYAPHLAFWQVVFGGLSSSILILSTGGGKVMSSEGSIAAIMKIRPSVILGVPSFVYHILRIAKEKGYDMSFVKKVVLGAAKVSEAFKFRLAGLLASMGAKDVLVFGTYGFTEARCAWVECPAQPGVSSGYHLYPDKEIFEVINPETGEVQKEGQDGELVYTSIDSRGSVVIRYRTGDFVRGGIIHEPCPYCKMTVPRISSDITRLSDVKDLKLSKIKGTLVDLNHFISVLNEMDDIAEWQLEIRKKDNDPYEVDEVVVYVACKNGTRTEELSEDIKRNILMATEVSPNDIIFLPLPEIVKRLELETAAKEKRIIDSRPKPP